MLGFREELVARRHFADLNSALPLLIVRHQLLEFGLHSPALFSLQGLQDRLERDRLRRYVDDGLNQSL